MCDIQLIPLNRKIIGNSVPSKAALVMACRRLIVNFVDEDSEYYERFILNKIGVSVSNLNFDKCCNFFNSITIESQDKYAGLDDIAFSLNILMHKSKGRLLDNFWCYFI